MKRTILCFLLLLSFAACHRFDGAKQSLLLIDSLSVSEPERALSLLDSMQAQSDSLPRRLRMKYHFLRVRAKDKAYQSLQSDTIMERVARYYRHHGTANEAMEATYLLGGVYRDRGESPRALDVYLSASEQADTTRPDCNYGVLARIHGQMAELFEKQFHPYLTLKESEKSMYYALKDKDTISYYLFMGGKSAAYSFLSMDDSVRLTSEKIYKGLLGKCATHIVTASLYPALYILLKQGDLNHGYEYLRIYETSIIENPQLFRNDQIAGLYQAKAMFYYGKEEIDSSIVYYRRQLAADNSYNTKVMAYNGLMNCYRKKHNADSLSLYTELYCHYNDSTVNNLNALTLERAHLLYNYKDKELQVIKKSHEASVNRQKANLLVFILFIIILSFVIIIKRNKTIKKRELEELRRQYDVTQQQLQKENLQYIMLQEKKYSLLLEDSSKSIRSLEARLKQIKNKINREGSDLQEKLLNSEIRKKFSLSILNPQITITEKDWQDLTSLVEKEIPSFRPFFFNADYKVSSIEYRLVLLVRTYFSPKEMGILLCLSPQYISIQRHRLYKRIFGKEGTPKAFDKEIKSIV